MPERIPQSVAIRVPLQAYLASDHVSPAPGLTIVVTISKNGGAYGNPSAGATVATEIANGSYYVDLSTTDTGTVGPLFVRGAVATMDPITAIYNVVTFVEQTGDCFARLGAPAGASVSADVAATKALLPTALVGGRMDSSVGAMASGVLTATAIAADAITDAKVAADVTIASVTGAVGSVTGNVGGSVASVVGAVGSVTGLTASNLDATVSSRSTYAGGAVASVTGSVGSVTGAVGSVTGLTAADVGAIKAKTDNLPASPAAVGSAMTLTSGERTAIANEVEAQIIDESDSEKVLTAITDKIASVNPSLGSLTVAAIASATAAQVTTDHGSGSYARNTEPLDAAGVRAAVGLASANLDTQLDAIPTNAELATAVGTPQTGDSFARIGAAGAGLTALGDARLAHLDVDVSSRSTFAGGAVASVTGAVGSVTGLTASDVGAIKAKTDNLPSDPADQSLVIAATDAVMGRLGAPAGASVSADLAAAKADTAAIKAKTDALPGDPASASDVMSANVTKVNGVTVGGAGTTLSPWGPA